MKKNVMSKKKEDISKKINKKLKSFSLKKGFIKKRHLKNIKCVE